MYTSGGVALTLDVMNDYAGKYYERGGCIQSFKGVWLVTKKNFKILKTIIKKKYSRRSTDNSYVLTMF